MLDSVYTIIYAMKDDVPIVLKLSRGKLEHCGGVPFACRRENPDVPARTRVRHKHLTHNTLKRIPRWGRRAVQPFIILRCVDVDRNRRGVDRKLSGFAAMLTNVLKKLAHEELVRSIRGAKGGYTLSRPADQITLETIIRAIEGPVRFVQCTAARETARQSPAPCRPDRGAVPGGSGPRSRSRSFWSARTSVFRRLSVAIDKSNCHLGNIVPNQCGIN